MATRWFQIAALGLVVGLLVSLFGIGSDRLDRSIPLIQTPDTQLATIRFMYWNNEHAGTSLFDRQGREVERFTFGGYNSKFIRHYTGDRLTGMVVYFHGGSDGEGCHIKTAYRYTYDGRGKLAQEVQEGRFFCQNRSVGQDTRRTIAYRYTPTGDTLRDVVDVPAQYRPKLYANTGKIQYVYVPYKPWWHRRLRVPSTFFI